MPYWQARRLPKPPRRRRARPQPAPPRKIPSRPPRKIAQLRRSNRKAIAQPTLTFISPPGHAAEDEYEVTGRNESADRAIEYYKKALALDPGSSVIIERLAETYAKSQRTPDAVSEAEQAIKADPDNQGPHRLLARIYVRNLGELKPRRTARNLR